MQHVAMNEVVDKESLTKILQETYLLVPEGTPPNIQLLNSSTFTQTYCADRR